MSARDLSVVFGVVLIIIMLVIPLPPFLLSILIIINIALSLLVLLGTMNMHEALDFSIFPSLLLLLTLYRLGLNVSTTRSILSKGDAGGVIETFGSFVVGGMYWSGWLFFSSWLLSILSLSRKAQKGLLKWLPALPSMPCPENR